MRDISKYVNPPGWVNWMHKIEPPLFVFLCFVKLQLFKYSWIAQIQNCSMNHEALGLHFNDDFIQ